ncbi:hypothetical protein D6C78_07406 [Aureobasidium pullulans]|uniref:Uncharacterized protein n=2 Tax=Aureobasidium pullulans TaxID=5580 RepID=A0A074X0H6_AURPU|nr:uncharacterized protein M438DRAFT_350032 [Aureobasidium pullulans EXF-150]THV77972.1 hypothetical protein D6D29_08066 [Aureobasidium pullulans]KEQ78960.1 hypothetical protein M438DRAFT_350032 [Aureobasidium pullulans EXF-150]THW68918.1 hypothetical protein D6D25_01160 [Aureobasidium pullulans]THX43043.1 hypothetical protein D6D10_01469 [Aureobasidium pullulans]THY38405.1 hypothetical protein D6C99_09110 [Aureobasidium pullulans]
MQSGSASASTETWVLRVMRAIGGTPSPVLRVRGTHKSTSNSDEQAVDFDLSLDRPTNMVLQDLRLGDSSYHPDDLHELQKHVKVLCNGSERNTEKQTILFRIQTKCCFVDEPSVQSSVTSLCDALRYAGTVMITMANNDLTVDVALPEARTEGLYDEIHVIEVRWGIHWPVTDTTGENGAQGQSDLWRRRLGDAIIDGERNSISLETMKSPNGKSLLRNAMAQRKLAEPVSQRTDENGIKWTELRTTRWGEDEA